MKILTVNETTYQMSDKMAKATLETAKGAMKGKNAIYALEKGNIIEMRKDIFASPKALNKVAMAYLGKGFKVKYVMCGSNESV